MRRVNSGRLLFNSESEARCPGCSVFVQSADLLFPEFFALKAAQICAVLPAEVATHFQGVAGRPIKRD